MQIIVFKCKVNICSQDLGAFCRERTPEGKKRDWGGAGATEPSAGWESGRSTEVIMGSDGVEWASWVALAMLKAGCWLMVLQSLLGWLWWHWIVLLARFL